MEIRFIYVPCSSVEEAKQIGRKVVEERLAACVNIIPKVWSYYFWQGDLTEDQEAVLIIKTSVEHVTKVSEVVSQLHSYSCPAILSWQVKIENQPYAEWFQEQVSFTSLSHSSGETSGENC